MRAALQTGLALLVLAREAAAADPAPDKSSCSLFAPVPDSQLRDMDTDRPNITNTPHTIDAGHSQLEAGIIDYGHFRDDSAGSNVRSDAVGLGQFNFRLGVTNDLELNAAIESYETDRTRDYAARAASHSSGFGDLTVGGKLNLWGDDGGAAVGSTALALQPQFKFPTAGGGLGNGRFEAALAAPILVNLPAGFHLGLQPGLSHQRNSSNTGYVTGMPGAVSIDRVVVGDLDVYLEYAAQPTTQGHAVVPQTVDFGGTYPLGRNVVADAGCNLGLDRAANSLELLAGISFRR